MAFSPARHALSRQGRGRARVLRGCRTLRGRRLQPPEHRRFGEEPCATHLPPGQVAALEEIIHHVRRDGEALGGQLDIEHLGEACPGSRPWTHA